ncbi:transposase [Paenibacillus sp. V4I9]|uniref:IS1182 family transposase n=1 Tax=Paenibacillus sp. V4I9 TaxID=3042308 RepID=UPI002788E927|nr:IS1182 family transposase [Paenibacillus sp. V4I9]MDQ0885976.1 transposase [Paenibacillus sp. V4I9]MDQ0886272.1 transposase [Paenibacillus sp. V4I9]
MMGVNGDKQHQFIFLNLEDYVPKDHLLRIIQREVDVTFIYDKVKHLYSLVGRKSIDPVLLMKMMLIGYLYGISSERKLEEEVKMNLAYRWFLGLDLMESVPDHSTLSQNRRRRFKNSSIFQEIFDHIVTLCIQKGIVTGDVIVTDSTHVKASASLSHSEKVKVDKKPSEYLEELEKEARRLESQRQVERDAGGKKKCGRVKQDRMTTTIQTEVTQSLTDPETGLMNRPKKPIGFHFLSHTSIDTAYGIITDIHVTPGNVNDHEPYAGRLAAQQERFNLEIKKVCADKGYDCAVVHHALEKQNIEGYISPIVKESSIEAIGGKPFQYDEELDTYLCPEGKTLKFTHVEGDGMKTPYRSVYAAKTKDCKACPLREQCFGKSKKYRVIRRTLFHEATERNKERAKSEEYRNFKRLRSIWCEGTFGIMKQSHNLSRTYKRGIRNATEHCLFSALALNIKRMIKATV